MKRRHKLIGNNAKHLCKGTKNTVKKIQKKDKTIILIPSTRETQAGRALSLRPAWSTKSVPGQPRLHTENLSQKPNNSNDSSNK